LVEMKTSPHAVSLREVNQATESDDHDYQPQILIRLDRQELAQLQKVQTRVGNTPIDQVAKGLMLLGIKAAVAAQ